ncbi:ABC-type Fe3+/spermidine/putrescine transport systems, ATPase components [Flavobacteriaceae bacterium MAR_2010_188]|nr:ABC-type Fe3+/spermidine/putrescine transport systems, ATPase components [Flavobacteriaceae bacterium MAR_2010_188]
MLKVENVTYFYSKTPVLEDISFNLKRGGNLAIIGESGSGKSTLLKAIYGTFDLPKGTIFWNEEPILGPAFNLVVGYDFMKYVAQEFDLMPFITVEENIGKFLSNFFPEEKKERTKEILDIIELGDYAKTKVKNLSGGQKQRVALGRAIANKPEIILLDEPFSHIDNFKKRSLRRNVFSFLKKEKISCIVATHDKDDVMAFSDELIVLNNGQIVEKGTPKQLYNQPKTELIASFFEPHNKLLKSDILENSTDEDFYIYASQLREVEKSNLKVIVEKSYFEGNHFLIEGSFKAKPIFFNHENALEKGQTVYLEYTNPE